MEAGNYGALPGDSSGVPITRTSPDRKIQFAAGATLVLTALLAFAFLAGGSDTVHRLEVLVTKSQLSTSHAPDGTPNPAAAQAPSDSDFVTMQPQADQVVSAINANATELAMSCGALMTPCVASVGSCMVGKMTNLPNGHVDVSQQVCQCMVQGIAQGIPVPGKPEVARCSLGCLNAIDSFISLYVQSKNGNDGQNARCGRTLKDIAESMLAGPGDSILPDATGIDEPHLIPLGDPAVVNASAAFMVHVNWLRMTKCHDRALYTGAPTTGFAERSIAGDGYPALRLEVTLGKTDTFVGRVYQLPPNDQTFLPTQQDPYNFLGTYRLETVKPDPCSISNQSGTMLAVTTTLVDYINTREESTWKASLHSPGKLVSEFAMGLKFPEGKELEALREKVRQRAATTKLDLVGFNPPAFFDARDKLMNQTACKAFDVVDQGSCGSCYACSSSNAISARLCMQSDRKWNVVVSPQDILDCSYGGCQGGWPPDVFEKMSRSKGFPGIPLWCDPYMQRRQECKTECKNGPKFFTVDDSTTFAGGFAWDATGWSENADMGSTEYLKKSSVLFMQYELLQNGPGVVGIFVWPDFMAYKEGVYVKSPSMTGAGGGHAVVLVGWGTDMIDGKPVDYWLCQNSWGTNWGMKGFFKIRRGTNEIDIERWGLMKSTPEIPAMCADSPPCKNGGEMIGDCSCMCPQGFSGPDCSSSCALTCDNGGILDKTKCTCKCPLGTKGATCSTLWSLSSFSGCSTTSPVKITWNIKAPLSPPSKNSYVAFFPLRPKYYYERIVWSYLAYPCTAKLDAAEYATLCPATGEYQLPSNIMPTAPGTYKVIVMPYKLPDANGNGAGYPYCVNDCNPDLDTNTIGLYTVLPSGCTAAQRDAAAAANNDALNLKNRDQAEQSAALAVAQESERRYLEAQAAKAAMPSKAIDTAQAASLIYIEGAAKTKDGLSIVWADLPMKYCFNLHPDNNMNPKAFRLCPGTGIGYWPGALVDNGEKLSTGLEDCKYKTVNEWIPRGVRNTVRLVQDKNGLDEMGNIPVIMAKATVSFDNRWWSPSNNPDTLILWVSWQIDAPFAHPEDRISLVDNDGKGFPLTWWYTGCASTFCPSTPSWNAYCDPAAACQSIVPTTTSDKFTLVWALKKDPANMPHFPLRAQFISGLTGTPVASNYDWIQWPASGWGWS